MLNQSRGLSEHEGLMEEMEHAPSQVAADLRGQARARLPRKQERPQTLGAAQRPLDELFYRALEMLDGVRARSRGRQLIKLVLEGLLDEATLAPKMIIDRPLGNAGMSSDLLHRSPLTALSKELQRRGEEALTG
jgi:hypothetical protein